MRLHCPHCETVSTLDLTDEVETVICPSCGRKMSGGASLDETIILDPQKSRLAHFQLIERVGRGTFGSVWKARDEVLDRIVAVKVAHQLSEDHREVDQFFREARAAARLQHPSIVSVHEVGQRDDHVFIVSDYIDGVTLRGWMDQRHPDVEASVSICLKIARAVHHAHEMGIIHRDLKPSNVLLGPGHEPFVTDFGIAKRTLDETTFSVDGRVVGTPAYMPPEQGGENPIR